LFSSLTEGPKALSTQAAIASFDGRDPRAGTAPLYGKKTTMTEYEIHPAIGIARLGSSRLTSEEGFFLGPEPGILPPSKYRDPEGNLKRQAARFRVFECRRDDQRRLVDASEVTLASVRRLTWTVHLVNRKGVARRQYGFKHGYRNGGVTCDPDDPSLIIDPGARSVSEPDERQLIDTGRFRNTTVPLGEMAMQHDGRLLVLGGYGTSGSDPPQAKLDLEIGHFADNEHWYDDISDGPVTATVELADGTLRKATAWVIVGPPDFAPGITNLITLYDLLFDLGVKRGLLTAPTDLPGPVSFARHVQPILARSLGYRWVNRAAAFGYGDNGRGHAPGGAGDFASRWAALADPSPRSSELRASLVGRLRNPDQSGRQPDLDPIELLPRLSDADWMRSSTGRALPLTLTQYKVMQAWGRGDFVNDLDQPTLDNELLPHALTRVSLEACVGAALYPGVEVNGYIMNFPERFVEGEPFRICHDAVRPGEVTQYNAVPWQADFHYCRWEETRGINWRRLGWWPAQRPDDVHTRAGSPDMVPWARGLGPDYQEMIDHWDRLGMVVDRGSPGSPFFVEDERDTNAIGP
jgi:L-Lysine epsilon oxidase N-terminal/L-lysine epsilon oxidase C-terminal domain